MSEAALRATVLITTALALGSLGAVACTSFVLDAEEGPIFACNLEYGASPVEGLVYVNGRGLLKHGGSLGLTGGKAEWVSRFGSLTFNFAGWQHPWAGVNEAGLVVSTMAHSDGPSLSLFDQRPQLDSGAWLQHMLDTCATIDDVVRLPETVRMGATVDHYLVADRTGDIAVIEFIDRAMHLHRGEGLPHPVLTNRTYRDVIEFIESGDYLRANACGDLLLDLRSSEGRFLLAADRLYDYPEQTETGSAIYYAFNSLAIIGQENARWSLVFDIGVDSVYFRTSVNPQIRWIDLSKLDFSCDQDGATLDIHADLHGDVTGSFQPFSIDRTTAHFVWFRSFHGAPPPQIYRDLVNGFEGFPCDEEGAGS